MGEPAELTEAERAATLSDAQQIIEAVRNDDRHPFAPGDHGTLIDCDENVLEMLILRLSQEVVRLDGNTTLEGACGVGAGVPSREIAQASFIKIDVVEELLKGIEIVHGKQYADSMRLIVRAMRLQANDPAHPAAPPAWEERAKKAEQELEDCYNAIFDAVPDEMPLILKIKQLHGMEADALVRELRAQEELTAAKAEIVKLRGNKP